MRSLLMAMLLGLVSCGEVTNGCEDNPCENDGVCTEVGAIVQCECAPGFEGVRCAINTDDCDSNPCLNGGNCVDGVDDFTCECEAGFAGDFCESEIDECSASPCLNGGACTDMLNGFSCACLVGFSGDTCATCTPTVITKDFTTQGTFVAQILQQTEVAISALSSTGGVVNVNILNFNGLGVFGGTSDNSVDNTESLTFTFSRPMTDVSYNVNSAGNGDGNGTVGDASFEAFGVDNASFGVVNTTTVGQKVVSPAGNPPLSKFIVRSRLQDNHRINAMTFTTTCPP